ncbi:hypothetical protein KXV85_005976, partial [Aspergillus fumigatus]
LPAAAIERRHRQRMARDRHGGAERRLRRGLDGLRREHRKIGDQADHEADQREDEEIAEHHGIVAVEHAFEAEQAEPVEREDGLDQERAGEEGVDEGAGETRDHDQHGIAEDVAIEHLMLGAAFGARGHDVLLANFVEEG